MKSGGRFLHTNSTCRKCLKCYLKLLHSLHTACHMGDVVLTLFLLFDISVAKEFPICYYYWFNGPRKQWLRNLHTVKKCRLALL